MNKPLKEQACLLAFASRQACICHRNANLTHTHPCSTSNKLLPTAQPNTLTGATGRQPQTASGRVSGPAAPAGRCQTLRQLQRCVLPNSGRAA